MNATSISERHTSGSTFIWLAYTLFLFIEPVLRGDRNVWLGTIAVFGLFLGVFTVYIRTKNETLRRAMIAATFVLGLASFPWNGGASTFFIYTAGFLPFSFESKPVVLSLFGLEILGIAAETWFLRAPHVWYHVPWQNSLFAIFLMLVIGGGNIFFAEQRRAECKLRAAQEENIALAALAERERIARDLHDVLGHTLSVIVLKAELARRLITQDTARAAAEIAEVERTARTALAEVREAIGGYRAKGLLAEIEAARRTLEAAGVTLICDTNLGGPSLDSEAWAGNHASLTPNEETVLALALREAVTNIVRHARATICTLSFRIEDGQHRLSVEDNGEHVQQREGNGLRGMRERVEALGGRVSLDRNEGTRLLIALPLQGEAAR